MSHHFYALFEYLENLAEIDDYRFIIATDVRDLVFQTNPSTWLDQRMGDKAICARRESLRYQDEAWGNETLRTEFPLLYSRIASRPIWNAGVQAGDIRVMKDFWLQLSMICAAAKEPADQAAYNSAILTTVVGAHPVHDGRGRMGCANGDAVLINSNPNGTVDIPPPAPAFGM